MPLDLPDWIVAKLPLLAGVSARKLLLPLWNKVISSDNFDNALRRALDEVDSYYDYELFGNHTKLVFNNSEIKKHLKECLFLYGEPDKGLLGESIDFNFLPEDFYQILYGYLFEEIIKHDDLRKELGDWLLSQDITKIKSDVSETRDDIQEIKESLSELIRAAKGKEYQTDQVPKIQYQPVDDYLPRNLSSPSELEFNKLNFGSHPYFVSTNGILLPELIKAEKRVLILGIAGYGKSYELKNLAYHCSQAISDFYPILIRLNDIVDIKVEDLLDEEFSWWRQVESKKLVLIFDALDEVHATQFDLFVRAMNSFCSKYPESRIVVSCRNNFYSLKDANGDGGLLRNFSEYAIAPLSYEQITSYLSDHLESDLEVFMNQVWEFNIYDLIQSPFYLFEICTLYNDRGVLPKRKAELYDYLVYKRIEKDIQKFSVDGTNLMDYRALIEDSIKKVAFVAECLGKNYLIERQELNYFVKNPELIQRLKRTFLFNRGKDRKWEFEHNNFQEYLAAKFLSDKGVNFIKSIIAFPPDFKKIKPTWVNTLSFLVSILEPNSDNLKALINWLVDVEPDLLLRMEKDKVDLVQRERIVREIVLKYEGRELWLRSEKFGVKDLSRFVSESQNILDWIIDRLEKCQDNRSLILSIELLKEMQLTTSAKDKVGSLLSGLVGNIAFSDYANYEVVKLLIRIDFKAQNILKVLYQHPEFESSQYIRAALYRYISFFRQSDHFLDVLIAGIPRVKQVRAYINRDKTKKLQPVIDGESKYLIRAFENLNDPKSIKAGLSCFMSLKKRPISQHEHSILDSLLKKALSVRESEETIFPLVVQLFVHFDRMYADKFLDSFFEYFDNMETRDEAFKEVFKIYKGGGKEAYYSLPKLITLEGAGLILSEYKNGNLDDDFVRGFRNMISWDKDRTIHDWFYKALNEMTDNKFVYPPPKLSWEEKEMQKRVMDIDLLFDKEKFFEKAEMIFSVSKKEILLKDDVLRFHIERNLEVQLDNNLVPDILRDLAKSQKQMTLTAVRKFIDRNEKWEWLKISTLIDEDIKGGITWADRELGYMQNWFNVQIDTLNFKTAIQGHKDNGYSYRNAERYVIYLHQIFGFALDDKLVLDFIYMDFSHVLLTRHADIKSHENDSEVKTLTDWVESKIGFEKTKVQVLKCLSYPELYKDVRYNVFGYCARKKIVESLPKLLNEIKKSEVDEYQRRRLLDDFFQVGGNTNEVINLLDSFVPQTRRHSIELIGDVDLAVFEKCCLNYLKIEDSSEEQLEYIRLLLKHKVLSGYMELSRWIQKTGKLPYELYYGIDPPSAILEPVLKEYVNVYEYCLLNSLGDWQHGGRSIYLEVIVKGANASDEMYELVKRKFLEWIEEFEDHSFLYNRLDEIERIYYMNKSANLRLQDIELLIN